MAGFPRKVRERAVRMVFEHAAAHESQWAVITSIAENVAPGRPTATSAGGPSKLRAAGRG